MSATPFDTPVAQRINQARSALLARLVESFQREAQIETAVDVGCGIGYFAGCLQRQGLTVHAVDGRAENAAEAARRNPTLTTSIFDVEDPAILSLGTFDLALCFGLLYHLENPFRALRHLTGLTGKVLLIETVIAPSSSPLTVLYEEHVSANQGLRYIALIPSESWLVKCLYRCGFPAVYKPAILPKHRDFRASLLRRRRRTVLVAAKVPLRDPLLVPLPEPTTRRYLWDRLDVEALPPAVRVREMARGALNGLAHSGR
jgi:SAM-dependent methyltransferase